MNAEKIRALRQKRGLTQREAATAAGMKHATNWSNIELGRQGSESISVDLLERIARALHVKPADLLK